LDLRPAALLARPGQRDIPLTGPVPAPSGHAQSGSGRFEEDIMHPMFVRRVATGITIRDRDRRPSR